VKPRPHPPVKAGLRNDRLGGGDPKVIHEALPETALTGLDVSS